jgi:hypothetical protein
MQAKQVEKSPFFLGQQKSGTRVWHELFQMLTQNFDFSALQINNL